MGIPLARGILLCYSIRVCAKCTYPINHIYPAHAGARFYARDAQWNLLQMQRALRAADREKIFSARLWWQGGARYMADNQTEVES